MLVSVGCSCCVAASSSLFSGGVVVVAITLGRKRRARYAASRCRCASWPRPAGFPGARPMAGLRRRALGVLRRAGAADGPGEQLDDSVEVFKAPPAMPMKAPPPMLSVPQAPRRDVSVDARVPAPRRFRCVPRRSRRHDYVQLAHELCHLYPTPATFTHGAHRGQLVDGLTEKLAAVGGVAGPNIRRMGRIGASVRREHLRRPPPPAPQGQPARTSTRPTAPQARGSVRVSATGPPPPALTFPRAATFPRRAVPARVLGNLGDSWDWGPG